VHRLVGRVVRETATAAGTLAVSGSPDASVGAVIVW
jgi:hypothetical protein